MSQSIKEAILELKDELKDNMKEDRHETLEALTVIKADIGEVKEKLIKVSIIKDNLKAQVARVWAIMILLIGIAGSGFAFAWNEISDVRDYAIKTREEYISSINNN